MFFGFFLSVSTLFVNFSLPRWGFFRHIEKICFSFYIERKLFHFIFFFFYYYTFLYETLKSTLDISISREEFHSLNGLLGIEKNTCRFSFRFLKWIKVVPVAWDNSLVSGSEIWKSKTCPHSTEIFRKYCKHIPWNYCKIAKIFQKVSLILLKCCNNLDMSAQNMTYAIFSKYCQN